MFPHSQVLWVVELPVEEVRQAVEGVHEGVLAVGSEQVQVLAQQRLGRRKGEGVGNNKDQQGKPWVHWVHWGASGRRSGQV